jgi:hypothetical protein
LETKDPFRVFFCERKNMSHFVVYAILPKEEVDVHKHLEEKMEKFNENIVVDPYDEKCFCVGSKTRKEINKFIQHQNKSKEYWFKYLDDIKDEDLKNKLSERTEDIKTNNHISFDNELREHIDKAWKKYAYEISIEMEEKHPDKNKTIENCEECGGSGICKTTYNPNSKWDWWRIGGRWNGRIRNKYRGGEDGGFNFNKEFETVKENMSSVFNLLKDYEIDKELEHIYPFAILTPEGEWIEKGNMGWWGIVTNEKEDWKKSVISIYEKYKNNLIISLDCHI